jgi:hypothetical protein
MLQVKKNFKKEFTCVGASMSRIQAAFYIYKGFAFMQSCPEFQAF